MSTETKSGASAAELEALDNGFMGHPKPLRSLFFTEMWERFSYYSIRPLLVLFMVATVGSGGFGFDEVTASAIYGIFAGSLYLAAVPGGWLADNWLGQERALWWGSIVIALGHLCIALSAMFGMTLFFVGLICIVLGSGLFKTCISVMVGALYTKGDVRRDGGFTLFYMGINIGALLAALIVGVFKEQGMWHVGFGVGGLGMLVSLLVYRFAAQKNLTRYARAKGITAEWERSNDRYKNIGLWVAGFVGLLVAVVLLVSTGTIAFNPEMVAEYMTYIIAAVVISYFAIMFISPRLDKTDKLRLLICFILIIGSTLFWSSFEQQPTSFNLFADRYTDLNVLGFEIPSIWFQSLNPLFILLLAPIVSIIWVKLGNRGLEPSSMAKFALGMLLAAAGFTLMIFASKSILNSDGGLASPLWLVGSLLLLTLGELALSPVGLSSMTKLAPKGMQGQMMGLFFASIAMGNLVAAFFGGHVSADKIEGLPTLFTTMTIFLVVTAVVLLALAKPINNMLKKSEHADQVS
ncbi:MAG: peptide MFS transporter [Psychrobacter sp.]|jgi:POT family proton-dependent oligopeptide transporter|uniref:peptide MFS transporter n=1 Tax=Psychrobacter namhaensis TaxID=292734 RepID=UPI0018DF214D|nr:peptide MFS transporter [Psychrobacter namhaensis]MCD6251771.1 peptide MFS transporter [Psychrobacter sp.]|tara:strand:+ start:4363 stop:5925 length:1563 start_codon:yes stop_codon:yes gene_type:complete